MGEAATAVSDEAFSALAENLHHILETRALLCVIAPEDVPGEAVVEAALSRCDRADSVVVTTAAPGSLAALLAAFHAALHLGARASRSEGGPYCEPAFRFSDAVARGNRVAWRTLVSHRRPRQFGVGQLR